MNEKVENINSYIETFCDDPNSSQEWVKIKEFKILEANDKRKLILDNINEIKSFKLKEDIQNIKMKLKESEKNGNFEESIKLASELNRLNAELKGLERG